MTSEPTAGGLSPEATEVVLRRAVEMTQIEPATGLIELSPAAVAAIAAEVGVPSSAVAAAVAEHRAGVDPTKPSVVDKIVGPRVVWARRSSTLDEKLTKERAQRWLQATHGLRSRERHDGVIVATKPRGVFGAVAVGVRRAGGLGGLGRVRGVAVAAVDVDAEPGAVCVVADVGNKRDEALLGGAAVTVGGVAVAGLFALVAGPLVLIAVPVAAGAGAVTSRTLHRATIRQVTEDVEETVDGIAAGSEPPRLTRPRRLGGGRRR